MGLEMQEDRKGGRKEQEKRQGSLNSLQGAHVASSYSRIKLTPVLLWLPRLNLNTGQSGSYFVKTM